MSAFCDREIYFIVRSRFEANSGQPRKRGWVCIHRRVAGAHVVFRSLHALVRHRRTSATPDGPQTLVQNKLRNPGLILR